MSEPQKIKVLIADDHLSVRLGLKIFLETNDDMVIVGEAANGQQTIALCEALRPDVVLMDVKMPIMDGITATAIITHQHPEIGVVILTNSVPLEVAQAAYQAGAKAVLQKTTPPFEIRETILLAIR
ncbi:MAG: response regulator transcription factor [Chloroflexota bacterium]